jgi:acetolactate synthase-1/3 small subunit
MQQLISLLVENKPGALMRVAGVLTSRGYNIESLTVARTLDPTLSSMTIVANVDTPMRELLIKQIKRLVNVVHAYDLTEGPSVSRELALIKVIVSPEMRPALLKEADIFRARVVDASPTSYTLEVTGATEKLDALIALLHNYGEVEMIRSGAMAMARSGQQRLPNGFSNNLPREAEAAGSVEPEMAKRE